jgi:hypothetical protein
MGDPGPSGPPGEGLVWKDANGAVVANAFPVYSNHGFQMLVADQGGVFYEFSPLTGVPAYAVVDSTHLSQFWLTTNCTGDMYLALSMSPGTAFKYDNRLVALPFNVGIATSAGSYYSNGCVSGTFVGEYVNKASLDLLATLAPPLIGPGPYHVDRM